MCEYCDGKFREGREAIVWPDDLTLKWKLILRDYEKNLSMVCFIKFCPFCGRELDKRKETKPNEKAKKILRCNLMAKLCRERAVRAYNSRCLKSYFWYMKWERKWNELIPKIV